MQSERNCLEMSLAPNAWNIVCERDFTLFRVA
jgi:hypothetical protein